MRTLLILFALSFPGLASAAGIDQLKAFWANTQSAQGTFAQSVATKSGRKPQNSTGQFAFARPGKLRWTYEKPYALLLVADGEKLWSYDADLNQVTISKMDKALGASPAALLTGESLDKHFVLTEAGAADGLEIVDATPKASDGTFARVRIGLRDNLPRLMEVRDNFGQITTLLFPEFEPNPRLSKDTFRFVTPKGADVVGE
ncbi:MAG: outer membrane lipoprotein chaperone LolA [Rhodocyclaceae bacterium]|jgi:outer membrane lipoprotein carrier protein|nr:outer membrane lipoprotein chaperone LolA [Rhodocyclaceae bacterium]MDP3033248.1 outer membrane lipoprotein chaperone LolA [Rhodocyclaceae bacterium]